MGKVCFRCGIEKDLDEFHKNKRNTDGYKGTCKLCCRLYVDEHIEEKRQYERNHKDKRREKKRIYARKYRQTSQHKAYIEKTKESRREYNKQYYQTEAGKVSNRKSHEKNRGKYKENKELRRKRQNGRYNNDLDYNITRRLRSRFFKATHRVRKEKSVLSIIGCTLDEFKSYLASLFTENMSWELFQKGEIHADHIIPCEAFDMNNIIHQQACFFYRNFQPLWRNDNLKKRNIYSQEDFDKYMEWFMREVYNK